jgi:DNA modification methylase
MAEYRLICEDCLEVLPTIATASIDIVVTDPPYILSAGSTLHQSGKTGTWADMMNAAFWYSTWYKQVWRILKPTGSFWTFCNWRTLSVIQKAAMDAKIPILSLLVWDKEWIGPGGHQGLRPRYENVALMGKEKFAINDRTTDDIWKCLWSANKPNGHPAEKPVQLIRRILEVCELPEGATVVDLFMGSGTSGVAALELGYKYLGVEQDPEWLKIAEIRVAGAAAQGSFYQQRHLTTVCTGLAKAGQTQLGLQIE